MCLCIVWAHLYCTIFAFEGQNVENKNFQVKCCLLAFNIVTLGPAVSLELVFVSRAYASSYHAYHIYRRPVFSSETSQLHFEKATSFCREVLMFLPSDWLSLCFSSSMNRFIAPFVSSGTT